MKQSAELYRMAQLVVRPGNNGYAGSVLRDRIISKAVTSRTLLAGCSFLQRSVYQSAEEVYN